MKTLNRHAVLIGILIAMLLLTFSYFSSIAQINIVANVSTGIFKQKFIIELTDDSVNYFITLIVKDSISTNKEYENIMDNNRKKYLRLIDMPYINDTVQKKLEKSISNDMTIATEKYTYYSTYKTIINKKENVTFDNLIKLFNNENAIFFKTKKFYICLDDCPRVTIKVNGYKIISSISPNYDSHPEIFNFITSTLTFFRSKKLLSDDKNITNGY